LENRRLAAKQRLAKEVTNSSQPESTVDSIKPVAAEAKKDKDSLPGPADYSTQPALNLVYTSSPQYSLSSRCEKHIVNQEAAKLENPQVLKSNQGWASTQKSKSKPNSKKKKISGSFPMAKAASMKGRLGDAVLVFPSLRFDTLRVKS
jgi:hypothetical protein